jgi:shikimate dehydrogenase
MKRFGIIGYPLSHTFSPQIHQAAFRHYGIDADYSVVELPKDRFPSAVEELKREDWLGFNVTIPYKTEIFPYLDVLDPLAARIGALNTINITQSGQWQGYNTDYLGFLNPLQNHLNQLKRCLLIGAGGAALAVGFALLEQTKVAELVIINRSLDRAKRLMNKLNAYKELDYAALQLDSSTPSLPLFDLIINTTSVGMGETKQEMPLNPLRFAHKRTIVYDLIYNPLETEFLAIGRKKGLQTINGIDMLIGQAAESFKIWTGYTFAEKLRIQLKSELSGKMAKYN